MTFGIIVLFASVLVLSLCSGAILAALGRIERLERRQRKVWTLLENEIKAAEARVEKAKRLKR